MSAFPSAYIRDKVLESIFKNESFTLPSAWYLALYTSDPTAEDTGDELTGGSYARQSVTFAAASAGTIPSNSAVTYTGLPTAVIPHYAVFDAATSGNMIIYGELPSPVSTNTGDEYTIDSGGITFSLSGS